MEGLHQLTYSLAGTQTNGKIEVENIYCSYCGFQPPKIRYYHQIEDECLGCCLLCHMLVDYKPAYSKRMKICVSKLSQIEIIERTICYVREHKTLPKYTDIDEDAELTKCQPTRFFKNFTVDKFKFKDCKVFFIDFDITQFADKPKETLGASTEDFAGFNTGIASLDMAEVLKQRIERTNEKVSKWQTKMAQQKAEYSHS